MALAMLLLATVVAAQVPATGRIAGRVVHTQTGQPVVGAQIVVDSAAVEVTDLDGRYRTPPLPAGSHLVRARRVGMQAKQIDGVVVKADETTILDIGLETLVVSLQSVTVTAERASATSSAAGLLSIQQKAAAASDGISAEQISRTPDADAAGAAQRVSGVSVVDNKFVVVRGLAERYSNTLLNGAEIASPEPSRKLVPLDIFPSGLLESIVVTKSATPDKPGDFSGGSVEIHTQEFPENTVHQFGVTFGTDSRTTFKQAPVPERRGVDYLGFDGGHRTLPAVPESSSVPGALERFGERLRNVWSPPTRRIAPNLKLNAALGGRTPAGPDLGYLVSLTYSANQEYLPDRFAQFFTSPEGQPQRAFAYKDARATVDWGALANVSLKLGRGTKFGFKNLYTRGAEDLFTTAEGTNVDRNGPVRAYQVQYIERDLLQSQLVGEHLLALPFDSRVEWRATFGRSHRDEPDNRRAEYLRPPTDTAYYLGQNNDVWFRFLVDRSWTGQLDWSIPLGFWPWDGAQLKVGGLGRTKTREFTTTLASFNIDQRSDAPRDLGALPPDQLFLPENIGTWIQVSFPGGRALPYSADDDLYAYYGMVDVPLFRKLRVVGGARVEDWRLDLFDGGRAAYAADTTQTPTRRHDTDLLWSANATYALTDRMNLRLAAFRSLARPDTRELSRDEFTDIVGSCPVIGNPSLQRSLVLNGDLRWEWYPDPGELLALSAFVKDFDAPIIRAVNSNNNCQFTFENAISARNYGGELDLRKRLAFLPGVLTDLTASANVTWVQSRVTIDPRFGVYDADLPLEGQSPWLVNAGLGYASPGGALAATVLYNYFDDRVTRYGFRSGGGQTQGPNIVESGRGELDAKLQLVLGRGLRVSASARNLTNAASIFTQAVASGVVRTSFVRPGIGVTLGFGIE